MKCVRFMSFENKQLQIRSESVSTSTQPRNSDKTSLRTFSRTDHKACCSWGSPFSFMTTVLQLVAFGVWECNSLRNSFRKSTKVQVEADLRAH